MRALVLILACSSVSALRVLVTGAGGRTGGLVFRKFNEDYDSMDAVGLVRSKKAVKTMKKMGASDAQIFQGDSTDAMSLAAAMAGCDALVLCTSAVPKILPFSIVKMLFKKKIMRREDAGRMLGMDSTCP